jgi:hypothetical protein
MRTLFLLAALILAPATAVAQINPMDAKIDCSRFSKKADGTWFAAAQTTLELSGSKITVPAGDIGPRMLQFGMADLHSVLENACRDKKAAPSQGPQSERETTK